MAVTKASSVAHTLKLSNVNWVSSTLMNGHQERLGAAQLGLFVGADFELWLIDGAHHYSYECSVVKSLTLFIR